MKKYIPFAIAFALFMETLDATIISTSIPKIALSLGTDPISLKIALTSYLLSLAVFIPVSGWFADRYGSKKVYITALIAFTIGSLMCGAAINLATLVISRIIQGIGGALMMPIGRLILVRAFPKGELVKVTNYVTIPSLMGPALGPVIGGIISNYVSWRWIFLVNIPFGLIGAIFSYKVLNECISKDKTKLDVMGFMLLGLGLSGLSFAFESIGENSLDGSMISWMLLASIFALSAYFVHSRKTNSPVVDLKVFKIPTFRITVLGSLLSRCGIGGMPFLLPLFFQLSLNMSPLYSGFLLLPYAIAMLIMKFLVKKLLKLFGFRKLLIGNTLLLGFSIFTFTFINTETPLFMIVILSFMHGLFTSLQFSCMNVLSYVDLTEKNVSKGTSIASAIQQLSMSFGIAISAILLRMLMGVSGDAFIIRPHVFHETFIVLSILTAFTSIVFTGLKHAAGAEASGHKPLNMSLLSAESKDA